MANIKIVDLNRETNHEVLIYLSKQNASSVVGGALFPNQKACTTGIALEVASGVGGQVGAIYSLAGQVAQFIHC